MHLDNLAPLLRLWPLAVLLAVTAVAYFWLSGNQHRRDKRRHSEQERRYRFAELAHRGRMRVRDWLSRTKTPRITYQGPPIERDPAKASERRR